MKSLDTIKIQYNKIDKKPIFNEHIEVHSLYMLNIETTYFFFS